MLPPRKRTRADATSPVAPCDRRPRAALAARPSGLRARLVTGGRADAAHTEEEEEDGRELGPTVPVL